MKILVVSQYFWPENFRVNDLCSELIKRGHEVTVLTSTPNYPKGRVFDEFKKNRESYTKFHGAEVIRVPQIPRGTSLFQLLLNYISFSFMATILGLFRLRKRNFDVIYLHQLTPIFSVIPGVIFGKIRKIPSVIWVLDIWPDALNIVGIDNKYIHSTIGLIVRQVYKNCHSILIQSRGFEQSILENGVNKEKIIYFPSWSEDIFLKSVGREEISPVRKLPLKLLFAGNVGDAQGFPFLLRGLKAAKDKGADFLLDIVGEGRALSSVQSLVDEFKLDDRVFFKGAYPLEKMPEFYNEADVLIVSLKPGIFFSRTIPGKLQTYLAAGKPVLGMISGEGKKVIIEANCGLVAEPAETESFSYHLLEMTKYTNDYLSSLGQNGRKYAGKNFNRKILMDKFVTYLNDACISNQ